jgi:cytochrome oxidase Cu insertion factor (SCO1/SenC/PrrC family)
MRICTAVAIGIMLLAGSGTALGLLAERGKPDSALAHTELPYYASADLQPRWDWLSRQHQVGQFALRDAGNRAIDNSVLNGRATVISFFYTACVSTCPISTELLMRARLSMVARGRAPHFLSISIAPLADTPDSLRAYAASVGLPAEWQLATGQAEAIAAMARSSFFSVVDQLGADGLPPHLNRAFLVDQQHRIRGVYDAASVADVLRLQDDVGRL